MRRNFPPLLFFFSLSSVLAMADDGEEMYEERSRRYTDELPGAEREARLQSRQLEELMQREYQSRTMHELTAEERDTIAAMLEEEQDRRARAEADRSKLQVGAIM